MNDHLYDLEAPAKHQLGLGLPGPHEETKETGIDYGDWAGFSSLGNDAGADWGDWDFDVHLA
jgi:hypothetical protein